MKSRTGMMLVAAIFFLPPVTAWMFHLGVFDKNYDAGSGKNYGELIHPARPLENFEFVNDSGKVIALKDFSGLWSLLEIANSPCVDNCLKNIYKMRQIRLALGKEAHRTQRVVIADAGTDMTKLIADNPGTKLYRITPASAPFLQEFPGYIEGDIAPIAGRIYIVDPLGNLMMQYPNEADPSAVLKDMRHLLKASWLRPTSKNGT